MKLNKIFILCSFFLFISCGTMPQGGYIIEDFLIVPSDASNNISTKKVNLFVFENDLTTPPIEYFLTEKFKLETFQTREFWITTDTKDRLYIKILDKEETEKFLDLSQYGARVQETKGNRDVTQSKFLAFSIADETGQDCLNENSLYYNIAINYLKRLKDDYLKRR